MSNSRQRLLKKKAGEDGLQRTKACIIVADGYEGGDALTTDVEEKVFRLWGTNCFSIKNLRRKR